MVTHLSQGLFQIIQIRLFQTSLILNLECQFSFVFAFVYLLELSCSLLRHISVLFSLSIFHIYLIIFHSLSLLFMYLLSKLNLFLTDASFIYISIFTSKEKRKNPSIFIFTFKIKIKNGKPSVANEYSVQTFLLGFLYCSNQQFDIETICNR